MKKDCELFEIMLENADIFYKQGSYDGITFYFELDNNIRLCFGDDGELTGIHVGNEG